MKNELKTQGSLSLLEKNMDTTAVRIDLSLMETRAAPITDEVVVGKDILELLAGAMYVDPLTIYREYIQNAADAIDEARRAGDASEQAETVSITFDHAARSIRIRDLGCGVPNRDFVRRLTSIGASRKRGASQRGFRGVGRLSGLGYCQELVFRSRASGEPKVYEMSWNGRLLRDRLRDPGFKGSLVELIREIGCIKVLSGAEYPAHFFEVELLKVLRIKNDVLMNEEVVRQYLSQVAPVPFDPSFSFVQQISEWLSARGIPKPILVVLNDGKGPVFHRATSNFALSKHATESFTAVEFCEFTDRDGDVMAFGWILEHGYKGALPKSPKLGGIRVRTGNIQVGDELVLSPYFTEPRFTLWAAGDIHVVHPRIVPNGRRDDFEAVPQYAQFQDELRTLATSISQKARVKSEERNKLRRIVLLLSQAEAWLACSSTKRLHRTIRRHSVDRAASFAAEAASKLNKIGDKKIDLDEVGERVRKIQQQIRRAQRQYQADIPKGRKPLTDIAILAILENCTLPQRAIPFAEKILATINQRRA